MNATWNSTCALGRSVAFGTTVPGAGHGIRAAAGGGLVAALALLTFLCVFIALRPPWPLPPGVFPPRRTLKSHGTLRDVTEQPEAGESLRRSHGNLQRLGRPRTINVDVRVIGQGAQGRGRGTGAQPVDPLHAHEETGHPASRAGREEFDVEPPGQPRGRSRGRNSDPGDGIPSHSSGPDSGFAPQPAGK